MSLETLNRSWHRGRGQPALARCVQPVCKTTVYFKPPPRRARSPGARLQTTRCCLSRQMQAWVHLCPTLCRCRTPAPASCSFSQVLRHHSWPQSLQNTPQAVPPAHFLTMSLSGQFPAQDLARSLTHGASPGPSDDPPHLYKVGRWSLPPGTRPPGRDPGAASQKTAEQV